MVAPNGAHRGKSDHPALPVTISEIVETAKASFAAGAAALHLHIRDDDGQHSLDAGRYRDALDAVAAAVPGMQLQITTEAAGRFDVGQQLKCLELVRAKWASISVREIAREPSLASHVYGVCREKGLRVQHILYDADDAELLKRWLDDGTVKHEQRSVLLVLGRYSAGQNSNPDDLQPVLESLPVVSDWMVCAFGPQEHACLIEAAKLGGNCRVGFENSLVNTMGQPWPDNTASVLELRKRLTLALA